jgi:hypothetical protein
VTRYAAKVDANQVDIVSAFRRLGCSVKHLHRVGAGCPDIAVGLGGLTRFVEIKTDKGKHTQAQLDWLEDWTGGAYLVRNIGDVEACVASMKAWMRYINDGIRRELEKGEYIASSPRTNGNRSEAGH